MSPEDEIKHLRETLAAWEQYREALSPFVWLPLVSEQYPAEGEDAVNLEDRLRKLLGEAS